MAEGGGEGQTIGAHGGTPDVFLSYASQDSAVAEAVCEALEHAGVLCWIAPRDVTPGTFYADEIVHAIDAVKAIVLILSHNAATSPHVLREVERAASKRHPVVSLRIDHAPLPAGLEYFLNTSQWLDASAGDMVRAMPKLVAAVRLAIEKTETPAAIAATTASGTRSRVSYPAGGNRSLRRIAIVAGSLVAVAIAGFAAYRSWLPARRAVAPPASTTAAATPAIVPAALAIPEKSVAVLPFVDMSEKKDQEYFSDGMSEELIDMLTKIPELRVPARTSSFYFKGKQTTIADIAKALRVAHVVEGSVRKSGNTIRITAQLVRVDTGYQVWSETFDRQLGDIFNVQDEIASAVVKALKVSLLEGGVSRATPTSSTEAYTLYLQARSLWDVGTQLDNQRAVNYLKRVLQLDPKFAAAWALLAEAETEVFSYGTISFAEPSREAHHSVEQALKLEQSSRTPTSRWLACCFTSTGNGKRLMQRSDRH